MEFFQDSDFAGDLEDSESTSSGILCIFGWVERSYQLFGLGWSNLRCHRTTKSEVVDGTPALDLWDVATGVLHSSVGRNSSHSDDFAQGNFRHETCEKQSRCRTKQKRLVSKRIRLEEIDYVSPNVHQSRQTACFYIF